MKWAAVILQVVTGILIVVTCGWGLYYQSRTRTPEVIARIRGQGKFFTAYFVGLPPKKYLGQEERANHDRCLFCMKVSFVLVLYFVVLRWISR